MDADFRRIDLQAADAIYGQTNQDREFQISVPPLRRDRKTWVVFRGKAPGIYDY